NLVRAFRRNLRYCVGRAGVAGKKRPAGHRFRQRRKEFALKIGWGDVRQKTLPSGIDACDETLPHKRSGPDRFIVRAADRMALTRIQSPERNPFRKWDR